MAWRSILGRRLLRTAAALVLAVSVAACASNSAQNAALGINDPYEGLNRDVHAFNKGADQLVLRPVAKGYDAVTPDIVRFMVRNALNHLESPRDFVNHLLTGELRAAGRTLVRFALNTTVGFGGLLDPATDVALEKEDADFGKTLAVWGAGEGAYYEIPLIGPTTARHGWGRVVDIAFAPTTYIPGGFAGPAVAVVDAVDARATNADLIDDVLYGDGDSYAMTRSLYLQQRRAFVNGGAVFDDAPSFDGDAPIQ